MNSSTALAAEPDAGRLREDHAKRWLDGIRRGDSSALEEFYRGWFDRMVVQARRLTRRDEDFALDVVQDAMTRLIDKPPALESEAQLALWLKRTLLSAAIDRLRKERRARERESSRGVAGGEAAVGEHGGPHASAALQEQLAWLEESLRALPSSDRALLRMRFGQGATLNVAGDDAGMSPGAAHGRVRRVLEGLREKAREIFR